MSTNKNAVIRYMFIDELLKDHSMHYTTREIYEECNRLLELNDKPTVSLKTYQNDLNDIQMSPFNAEIVSEYEGKRLVNYYKDPTFSIFRPKLNEDEKHLLSELLNIVGGFDIEGFDRLEELRRSLKIENKEKIIDFEKNSDLVVKDKLFSRLFSVISAQKAIKLKYKKFYEERAIVISVSPLLLKQYNNRWFLIVKMNKDGVITNFPLDRIIDFTIDNKAYYRPDCGDLKKYFDDIVGVTLYKDAKPLDILIWADDKTYAYIDTKPIHTSQQQVYIYNNEILREKYPSLKGGKFFSYRLVINVEFMNILMSYAGVVVLEPSSLREDIIKRVDHLVNMYKNLKKNNCEDTLRG